LFLIFIILFSSVKSFRTKKNYRINYKIYGKENGNPVFYFHGAFGSHKENYFKVNSSSETKFIIMDRPGYGFSSFIQNYTYLSFMKEEFSELLNHLKIQNFSVIGYSAGGPFAITAAYLYPDRLNSTIVMNSEIPTGEFVFSTAQAGLESVYFILSKYFQLGLRLICWICSEYFSKNPEEWATFMSNASGGKSIDISWSEIQIATENYKTGVKHPEPVFYDFVLGNNHIGFDASKINTKSFHIYSGSHDGLTSIGGSVEMNHKILNSNLHVMEDYGHYLFTQEICEEILNFTK
jgi:pimeloyl-ACP methyl ester carboxylesterase